MSAPRPAQSHPCPTPSRAMSSSRPPPASSPHVEDTDPIKRSRARPASYSTPRPPSGNPTPEYPTCRAPGTPPGTSGTPGTLQVLLHHRQPPQHRHLHPGRRGVPHLQRLPAIWGQLLAGRTDSTRRRSLRRLQRGHRRGRVPTHRWQSRAAAGTQTVTPG